MGKNLPAVNDITAFVKTLSDPAGELVYRGESKPSTPKDELLLCTIKQGARFYSAPAVEQDAMYQLDQEKELEALYQQEGWTCAVIPGLGFGWVSNNVILNTEIETFNSTDRSDIRVEWSVDSLVGGNCSETVFFSFLEHVGRNMSYLSVKSLKAG